MGWKSGMCMCIYYIIYNNNHNNNNNYYNNNIYIPKEPKTDKIVDVELRHHLSGTQMGKHRIL